MLPSTSFTPYWAQGSIMMSSALAPRASRLSKRTDLYAAYMLDNEKLKNFQKGQSSGGRATRLLSCSTRPMPDSRTPASNLPVDRACLGLMAAMPQEIAAILPHLQGVRAQSLAGRVFHHGRWHGQPVVAVLSGIGKVAAATTATLLCARLGADHLVFSGVAGGLGADVAVGDLVLGTHFVQHDMDASPLFPRFELPGTGRTVLESDVALSDALKQALDDVHEHSEVWQAVQASGFVRAGGSRLHQGLILSGDRFVGDEGLSGALLAALPDALAVEMEGAAVAQVCHDLGVPFAVMRAISDRADDQAHVDFNAFLAAVASPMVAAWLDRWLARRALTLPK